MTLEDIVKQERAQWLEDKGFDSELLAGAIIQRDNYFPIETMQASYNYVTQELGLDVKVFDRFPALFGCAVEDTLKPKVEYITKELGLDVKVFDRFPQLFSYSIKNRIIPRWEFAKSKNKTNVTLDYLFIPNDTVFANRMGTDVAHYYQFREGIRDDIEETYNSLIAKVATN